MTLQTDVRTDGRKDGRTDGYGGGGGGFNNISAFSSKSAEIKNIHQLV